MVKVLKFLFEEKEGFLSVIEKDNRYYALVKKDTPKVEDALKTKKMMLSYEVKQPSYEQVSVQVLFDQILIKSIFQQLEIEKNLYFKQLDDTLCVLEIPKQK